MVIPRLKIDWTFNVGHIITVALFAVGGITAWFNLKEDVRVMKVQLSYTERAVEEIKTNQKENKEELRQEIRSLMSTFLQNSRR